MNAEPTRKRRVAGAKPSGAMSAADGRPEIEHAVVREDVVATSQASVGGVRAPAPEVDPVEDLATLLRELEHTDEGLGPQLLARGARSEPRVLRQRRRGEADGADEERTAVLARETLTDVP